jgi:hypothetical protein
MLRPPQELSCQMMMRARSAPIFGLERALTCFTADWRVEFFRRAFLRHAPQRYALMLSPNEAQRLGQ